MSKVSELESRGLDVDEEKLVNLTFADDLALITSAVEDMEIKLNILNEKSKKIGLKINKGKTKYNTIFVTVKNIEIEGKEIGKSEPCKYLGQTIEWEDRTANEV